MADDLMRKVGLEYQVDGIDQASKKTEDLADSTRDVSRATDEVRDSSQKATREVVDGQEKQDRGWRDLMASLGEYKTEIGAAGVAAGAAGAMQIDSVQASAGRLQAQLRLTEEQTAEVGRVARDVFTNNFADSLDEAGDVVALVRSSLADLPDSELQPVAEGVLSITDAFGHLGADADILVDDLRTMKANFPDKTEAEILDLIASSFQKGTGNAQDLQDTLQEYPGSFARIGLDADDMFGILDAGFQAGIRNTDFIADAVKEMGILLVDEGSNAAEALAQIFPAEEAERLRTDFASGGEAGRAAFFDILAGINAVEDPILQNNLAVEIMATKWEDNAAQMPAFLSALEEVEVGVGDSAGAVEALGSQYDNNASKLESWRRKLTTGVPGALGDVAGMAVEAGTGIGVLALGMQNVDFSRFRGKAAGLTGALGKIPGAALVGGAALGGLALVVADLAEQKAEAERVTVGLTDAIEADTGVLGDNTRAYIENELAQSGALEAAQRLGVTYDDLVDASMGQEDAQRRVAAALDEGRDSMSAAEQFWDGFGINPQIAQDLAVLEETTGVLADGTAQAQENLDYMAESSDNAATAANTHEEAVQTQLTAVERAMVGVGDYDLVIRGAEASNEDMAAATHNAAIEFYDLYDATTTVEEAVSDLAAEFQGLTGGQRDVRAASAEWHASLDELTESIEENGTTLDRTNEKGRANEAAIQAAQRAAEDHAVAVLEQTGSIDQANAALDQQREDLYDVLVQSGLSEEAARMYSEEIARIPDDASTRAEFEDAAARERIDGYVDDLMSIPGNRETYARFFTDDAALSNWINRLDTLNRTITTRGVFKSSGGPSAYADGTPPGGHPGGPAIINERGPELVSLPTGSVVTPTPDSIAQVMAAAGISGGGTTWNITGTPDQMTWARVRAREALAKL